MTERRLHGIVPALITPLNEDGSLDVASLETLIEYQLAAGVHGIFVAGMTGEGAALGASRLRELVRNAARVIRGRVPLCAGVLEASARRTIETAHLIENAGADLLSTTVPYGPPAPSQEEIIRHFEFICRNTSLPWMVYGNSGAFTDISPRTMARLADLDGIAAVKDTRPDFEGCFKNIMALRGSGVSLLCGGEYLVGPGLLFGADGNISGATNLFSKLFVRLYEDARAGDVEAVRRASEKIARIHGLTAQRGVSWLSVFKCIGCWMGLMQPWCCPPHASLNEEQQRRVFRELDLLEL